LCCVERESNGIISTKKPFVARKIGREKEKKNQTPKNSLRSNNSGKKARDGNALKIVWCSSENAAGY